MIESTFLHIPKVGKTTEAKLWEKGITTWSSFLDTNKIKGFSTVKKELGNAVIKESRAALVSGNSEYFTCIPSTAHWRLWKHFDDEAVYVDIETNWQHDITVLGIYDGNEVKQFVKGKNLTQTAVKKHLQGKIVVTYNGASFDLPIIRRFFGAQMVPNVPHFDTMHLARRLGYRGGLKALERSLGVRRPSAVEGMTGEDALHLWDLYRASGDEEYLQRLLAYNAEDIVNLPVVSRKLVQEATSTLLPRT